MSGGPVETRQHSNESDFQVNDDNKEPSSDAIPEPRHWKERYRWLGILMMAAFAGLAPAPPSPKPPRELYAQIAEDPDGLKLDPELHLQEQAGETETAGISSVSNC
jgi:hypothetical protein